MVKLLPIAISDFAYYLALIPRASFPSSFIRFSHTTLGSVSRQRFVALAQSLSYDKLSDLCEFDIDRALASKIL
jgi:hypothetical protein